MNSSQFPSQLKIPGANAIVVFLMTVLVLFGPMFLLGYTILQVWHPGVLQTGPYDYHHEKNRFYTIDQPGAYFQYAWDVTSKNDILNGSFPLWDPNQGIGTPSYFCTHQSGWLYPLCWIRLILPYTWWDIVPLIHFFLLAYFAYLYIRITGVNSPVALLAAITVISCGYFSVLLPLDCLLRPVPWFFFLLFALERIASDPAWRFRIPSLWIGSYCLLTSGNPSPTFIAGVALAIYITIRTVSSKSFRDQFWIFVGGMALGAFMAAPECLIFLEYARNINIGPGYPPPPLVQTALLALVPYGFGHLNSGNILGLPADYPMDISWFPVSTLFFAVIGAFEIRRQKLQSAHFAILVVCAVYIYKEFGLYGSDTQLIPIIRRTSWRYGTFLIPLALSLLAAYGIRALLADTKRFFFLAFISWATLNLAIIALILRFLHQRHMLSISYLVTQIFSAPLSYDIPLLCVFAWLLVLPLSLYSLHMHNRGNVRSYSILVGSAILIQTGSYYPNGLAGGNELALVLGLILYCLVTVLVHFTAVQTKFRNRITLIPLAATALVVAITYLVWPGQSKRQDFLATPPFVRDLRQRIKPGERIFGTDMFLFGNTSEALGLPCVNIWNPMVPPRDHLFLRNNLGNLGHESFCVAFEHLPAFEKFFDLIGVQYFITTESKNTLCRFSVENADHTPVPINEPVKVSVPAKLTFNRVGFFLNAKTAGGILKLELLANDRVIKEMKISGDRVNDKEWQYFYLGQQIITNTVPMFLRLSFEHTDLQDTVSAWRSPSNGTIMYRLEETLPVTFHDELAKVNVLENTHARNRVYLASSVELTKNDDEAFARIDAMADNPQVVYVGAEHREQCMLPLVANSAAQLMEGEPGKLLSLEIRNDSVNVDYDARLPGILVMTDSYQSGWHASIDGKETAIFPVCGLFRGVRLDKPGLAKIKMWYEPAIWKPSLLIAGLATVFALAWSWKDLRRRVPKSLPESSVVAGE